jgi:hypothetical protein
MIFELADENFPTPFPEHAISMCPDYFQKLRILCYSVSLYIVFLLFQRREATQIKKCLLPVVLKFVGS